MSDNPKPTTKSRGLSPAAVEAMVAGNGAFERRYGSGVFGLVTGLEEHVAGIERMARVMLIITLADDVWNDSEDALAIQEVLGVLEEHRKAIEEARCKLFHLTHPDREHFEKNGWPRDAPNENNEAGGAA
jgi:hypothetical protein